MSLRPAPVLLLAAAAALGAVSLAEESLPADPPARPARVSRLLTIGRAYTVEAGGCESRHTHFHVTAIQPIDRAKTDESQVVSGVFFRSRERTGQAGWRNVGYSPDGRSIEFDLYAQGAGTIDTGSGKGRCESPSAARTVVDIEAWVLE